MTGEAASGLAGDISGLPDWTLDENQLADLEMLLSGAFAPLTGFMMAAEVASVSASGTLPDGTAWPAPVTFDVQAEAVPVDARRLVLNDPERVPLAVLDIAERSGSLPDGLIRLGGPVTAYRDPEHGPFRHLRRSPAKVRAELGDGPALAFITRRPLTGRQIGQLRHLAGQLRARLMLMPVVVGQAEVVIRPEALVRVVRAATRHLPPGTLVVPLPLAARGISEDRDIALHAQVAAAYGATHLFLDEPRVPSVATAIPIVSAGDWAYDRAAELWRPLALIEPGTERADLAQGELEDLLDRGEDIPAWSVPPAVAAELRLVRPPRSKRGLAVFLTGLSGSGKSTIARGLRDALAERGDRSVSLLDGDLVRDLLSAGLTFSRADRDLNIVRIGFVAAEVARHGGIAICAPIAPYAAARAQVRAVVNEVGDFLLVHVATPIDVCEARDRKGMYAKARAGLIGSFTGVSDPYEEPQDADLVIDTSVMSRQQCVDAVLHLLTAGRWLAAGPPDGPNGPG